MKIRFMSMSMLTLSLCLCIGTLFPLTAKADDKTGKYRVYQNDRLLKEFQDYGSAEAYAREFSHSRVEEIGTRKWLWDNYPRYKVYQFDISKPEWEFATLEEAKKEAGKWAYASIRDLQSGGWVWNNYPRYRVYQGEVTLDSWAFAALEDAKAEAGRWANSHIIDLNTNRWIWDNIGEQTKSGLRAQPPMYQVYQNKYTKDEWKFAYLEDAVNEALKWADSVVVNIASGKTVYSNAKRYEVRQNDKKLAAFTGLDQAIDYAKKWAHSSIVLDGRAIWNNYPYYQVYQNGRFIGEYTTIPAALQYASQYSNAAIRTLDGDVIWSNSRSMAVWGWNGLTNPETIKRQVNQAAGLDVTSPPWFILADEHGNVKDQSDKDLVRWLKDRGIAVHPLVHNQFDPVLTKKFLSNPEARGKFIRTIVDRSSELGVDGLNIDFESLYGSDRAAFTAFITELSAYAHSKQLLVSVDLPRGSIKWNEKTAFDHEKLAAAADYIVIMAYDQYYRGSTSPGSVSGLSWTEEGIREFLSYGIPRSKLILGVPLYVRVWQLDASGSLIDNRAVYYKDIPDLIAGKAPEITWDPQFGQYRVEYEEEGYRHVFWMEDEKTVTERIRLAKKHELAGIAFWRLGYDNEELWQTVIRQK